MKDWTQAYLTPLAKLFPGPGESILETSKVMVRIEGGKLVFMTGVETKISNLTAALYSALEAGSLGPAAISAMAYSVETLVGSMQQGTPVVVSKQEPQPEPQKPSSMLASKLLKPAPVLAEKDKEVKMETGGLISSKVPAVPLMTAHGVGVPVLATSASSVYFSVYISDHARVAIRWKQGKISCRIEGMKFSKERLDQLMYMGFSKQPTYCSCHFHAPTVAKADAFLGAVVGVVGFGGKIISSLAEIKEQGV